MSNVGGNYMSDGAIMAWAAVQQNRLYGELKDTMASQEQRAQMASDLADIKKNLEAASRHTQKFPDLSAELQSFVDKYGDQPEFDELTQTVNDIKTCIDAKIAEGPVPSAAALTATSMQGGRGGASPFLAIKTASPSLPDVPSAAPPKYGKFQEESVSGWMDAIDKKLDASGTNEQLGMIHINELKATIDQGTQMASQMIKSGNDSLNTVINNFA